jgi:hypothetical protein
MANKDELETLPRRVESELQMSRDRLGDLLAELTRRRHDLASVWSRVLRHRAAVIAGAATVAAAGAALAWLSIRHARAQQRFPQRARRLRDALSRIIAHPERVAADSPGLGRAILKVALTGAAGAAAKRLANEATRRAVEASQRN